MAKKPSPPARPTAPAKSSLRRVGARRQPGPIVPWIILNAVEGFGKTSFLAYAKNVFILMAEGETGYLDLLASGLVPSVSAETVTSWEDTMAWLDSLIADPQDIEVLGLDALGGFERFCHEFTCKTMFKGNWGNEGFMSFHKGYDMAITPWKKMLKKCETLREKHGMTIVMLGHTKIKSYKNPLGADYDRFICDLHEKTWAATAREATLVMFGNFQTVIDKDGKSIGGTERVVFTERTDAYDAKNRHGMEEDIHLDQGPDKSWQLVMDQITGVSDEV